MPTMSEIHDVIVDINEMLWNAHEKVNSNTIPLFEDIECYGMLIATSTGHEEYIKFLGITLWDSDNEPREWNEDTNSYSPLREFLLEQISLLVTSLNIYQNLGE